MKTNRNQDTQPTEQDVARAFAELPVEISVRPRVRHLARPAVQRPRGAHHTGGRVMDELLPDAPWRVALLLARAGYDPMLLRAVSLSVALEVVWCQMHGIRSMDAIAKAMRRNRSAVRDAAHALRRAVIKFPSNPSNPQQKPVSQGAGAAKDGTQ